MKFAQWLRVLISAMAISLASGLAHCAPEVGWWWNPNESGRGFFIESRDDLIYVAGYFYDDDGRATWAVAGGPNKDPYHYDGRLLVYHHGQTLYGDYAAPGEPADIGRIALHFSDDTHGIITWPGGTIPIEREIFDTGTAEFQPSNGWWWNPDESGAGYSVEVQGDTLFIVAFMYDGAGNPIWYYSAGKMSSPTNYLGTLRRFANGQTLRGPYRPASKPIAIGMLSIKFTAHDEAMLTFSDDSAVLGKRGVKATRTRSTLMQRQFQTRDVLPQAFVFPDRLMGYVEAVTSTEMVGDSGMLRSKSGMDTGAAIVWEASSTAPAAPVPGGMRQQTYYPTKGSIRLDAAFSERSEARNCDLTAGWFNRARSIPGDIDPVDLRESMRLVLREDATYEFGSDTSDYVRTETAGIDCNRPVTGRASDVEAIAFTILAQKQTGRIKGGSANRYEMHGTWAVGDANDQYRITWNIYTPSAID